MYPAIKNTLSRRAEFILCHSSEIILDIVCAASHRGNMFALLYFELMVITMNTCTSSVIDTTSDRIIGNVVFNHQTTIEVTMRHWSLSWKINFNDIEKATYKLMTSVESLVEHKYYKSPMEVYDNESQLNSYYSDILDKQLRIRWNYMKK